MRVFDKISKDENALTEFLTDKILNVAKTVAIKAGLNWYNDNTEREVFKSKIFKELTAELDEEKTCEDMMTEIVDLYPKCEWSIRYFKLRDAGNELTPYTVITFGKYNEDGEFGVLTLTKDGNETYVTGNLIVPDSFECCRFAYETPLYDMIKEIYDGICNWKKEHEK